MYSEHDPASHAPGGFTSSGDPSTESTAGEPEPPGEPRIRAKLHDRTRWKQLFREAATLTLDTLDHVGDRVRTELGLHENPVRKDDTV